ncbi:MAG TPA: hypothetical protein VNM22_00320 [Candidatus Limnocylindrales bacterium]|nr:hypothetical protein [Candidatus Limnocylindrales bacterium]
MEYSLLPSILSGTRIPQNEADGSFSDMESLLKNPVFITVSEVGQYSFCPLAWYRERQGQILSQAEALRKINELRAKKFLSPEEKVELRYLLDLLEAYELLNKGLQHHSRISWKTRFLFYLENLIWISIGVGFILLTFLLWRGL